MFLQINDLFKLVVITFAASCLLVFNLFSAPPIVEGAESLQLGRSVESVSLGGVSLGLMPSAGAMLDHPAGGARLIRKNVMLQSGINMADISPNMRGSQSIENIPANITYIHPSPYGVFSGGVSTHFPVSSSIDLGYLSTISFTFAKNVTDFIDFGLRLNFDYVVPNLNTGPRHSDFGGRNFVTGIASSWGINLDWSLILHFPIDAVRGPWSFRQVRLGFGSRDVGWPARLKNYNDDGLTLDGEIDAFVKLMDIARVGVGFDFITVVDQSSKNVFTSRLNLEGAFFYPFDVIGGFFSGLKNTFYLGPEKQHHFYINLGTFFSVAHFDFLPITSGFGFLIHLEKVDLVFEQSLLLRIEPKSIIPGDFSLEGASVGFTFQVKFGKVDKAKPVIDTSYWGEESIDKENE